MSKGVCCVCVCVRGGEGRGEREREGGGGEGERDRQTDREFPLYESSRHLTHLFRTHNSEVMALPNLRALAASRAAECVASRGMLLKLPLLQLDIAVLYKAVDTESVLVRTVEH